MNAADTARRLVEDVQRLGLSSASAVVERYAAAVERTLGVAPPVGADGPPDPGTLVDATARMARAYLDLLDGLAGLVGRGPARAVETLRLPASRPGGAAEVSVWAHNGTADRVEVTVRPGPLVSAGGVALPTGAVTLTPPSVTVPARARGELRLRVDVPDGQPTGTYFGFALSTAAAPVALRLDVVEGGPPA